MNHMFHTTETYHQYKPTVKIKHLQTS